MKRKREIEKGNDDDGGGKRYNYFHEKNKSLFAINEKLCKTFADKNVPQLFEGMKIWINGSTIESGYDHLSLQRELMAHGAIVVNTKCSGVTHVLCENLNHEKTEKEKSVKHRKAIRFLKPSWAIESINKGKIEPWEHYCIQQLRNNTITSHFQASSRRPSRRAPQQPKNPVSVRAVNFLEKACADKSVQAVGLDGYVLWSKPSAEMQKVNPGQSIKSARSILGHDSVAELDATRLNRTTVELASILKSKVSNPVEFIARDEFHCDLDDFFAIPGWDLARRKVGELEGTTTCEKLFRNAGQTDRIERAFGLPFKSDKALLRALESMLMLLKLEKNVVDGPWFLCWQSIDPKCDLYQVEIPFEKDDFSVHDKAAFLAKKVKYDQVRYLVIEKKELKGEDHGLIDLTSDTMLTPPDLPQGVDPDCFRALPKGIQQELLKNSKRGVRGATTKPSEITHYLQKVERSEDEAKDESVLANAPGQDDSRQELIEAVVDFIGSCDDRETIERKLSEFVCRLIGSRCLAKAQFTLRLIQFELGKGDGSKATWECIRKRAERWGRLVYGGSII